MDEPDNVDKGTVAGSPHRASSLQVYLELQQQQLRLEIDAIRTMMAHAGTKGAEAELAFRGLLCRFLPKCYSIGTGFVSVRDFLSPQLDVIIYDNIYNVPVFEGAGSGVYAVESVYAVVEITMGALDRSKLKEDVSKYVWLRDAVKKYGKRLIQYPYLVARPSKDGTMHPLHVEKSFRPPLLYIVALSGASCATDALLEGFAEVTEEHDVLVDGLLVIGSDGASDPELLIWNQPQPDRKPAHTLAPGVLRENVLYSFLNSMKVALLWMDVGTHPGYPGHEDDPTNRHQIIERPW